MRLFLLNLAISNVVCFETLSASAQKTATVAAAHAPTKPARTTQVADSATAKADPASQVLKTRCLDTGLLRIGSACVFQVVEPATLGSQTFAAGDLIHAHVENVQGVAGRVFMRTDRVVCAKTQQVTALSMVATERPRQPGVGIPHLLDGWKLDWASR